ncbi:flagellar brake protein [Variovorax sp. E3]|jgi:c-di-GMP-binding flagellar brake protein YcgR|uniref:flagellar brake protein n=1 Tax=Variovorax sp. E3 TaxID=1914993 RepID=UPI0018DE41AA|nr:flagellar brake protein [Variovorax sp. E3]
MNQSTGQTDASGPADAAPDESKNGDARSTTDFARRSPFEIGGQLRSLVSSGDFLTVVYAGGQFVTQLLDVNVRGRTFIFDWGASEAQNQALLGAPRSHFHGQPDGVRVEFATNSPRETRYEGLPAFEADFPELLFYVQRREYFRVDAPMRGSYTCTVRLPKGDTFRLEVQDLSLGGVGVHTADERIASLPMGTLLKNCELSLGTIGRLSLDLELMSQRSIALPHGTPRYHMGFRFLTLPGSAESQLQRLITQLELEQRAPER